MNGVRSCWRLSPSLSRRYPQWRFGQLIANVAGWADQEIWDVEDEQLLAAAQSHLHQPAPAAAATSTASRTC